MVLDFYTGADSSGDEPFEKNRPPKGKVMPVRRAGSAIRGKVRAKASRRGHHRKWAGINGMHRRRISQIDKFDPRWISES